MKIPHIHHITINTGHCNRSRRADVDDATLAVLVPWLDAAVAAGTAQPLPVAALSHYSAVALTDGGGLICTIYAPSGPHLPGRPSHDAGTPLVTLGVAQRSRQGGDLWAQLVANFGAKTGLKKPAEPWCAVALHAGLSAYEDATQWLGDLERCIAWAWITRRTVLDLSISKTEKII